MSDEPKEQPYWKAFLDAHFREFASVALFLIVSLGGYGIVKMDTHVSEFGDKRWLQLVTYERDRAIDSGQRQLERQSDASGRAATDKELASIKSQNDLTQLAIERARLDTQAAFNRMADLIEKIRDSKHP